MRLLADTHLLLEAAGLPAGPRSPVAADLMGDPANEIWFSAASIWEVAIKTALNRPEFDVDPQLLRLGLRERGYVELPITGGHAAAVRSLPPIHRDPFDRMLVAQASVEGLLLITSDRLIARYPGPIRNV